MSEYLKDSGHHNMRTCDDCGGAFYCGDAMDRGEEAPDWTCETCTEKDATIKALADALDHLHSRVMLSAQSAALVANALRLAGRPP